VLGANTASKVLVTADWNETGAPSDCDVQGQKIISKVLGAPLAPTPPGTAVGTAAIISGSIPPGGGFGLVVFGGGTIPQLVSATGCPVATMALFATVNGALVAFVPGSTIAIVNAEFMGMFVDGTIPDGAVFIGRCR
jgi:hypothetical protein